MIISTDAPCYKEGERKMFDIDTVMAIGVILCLVAEAMGRLQKSNPIITMIESTIGMLGMIILIMGGIVSFVINPSVFTAVIGFCGVVKVILFQFIALPLIVGYHNEIRAGKLYLMDPERALDYIKNRLKERRIKRWDQISSVFYAVLIGTWIVKMLWSIW